MYRTETGNAKAIAAIHEVGKAVIGKEDCIVKLMAVLLAGGHMLLNDIPGVGKTTMAMAFAKALGLKANRIQFTPDVLPSDVLGFSIYNKQRASFSFRHGPIFCNLLLADELNRTSPKTQSALLEAMEEGCVTVEGNTYNLPVPFFVIATQNPCGSAGTQLLPDSQLDRFMLSLHMGYPEPEDELMILKGMGSRNFLEDIESVLGADELMFMQKEVDETYLQDSMYKYILKLVTATRNHELIETGVSPRGSLQMTAIAKAMAFLRGRKYVLPEDIDDIFIDAAAHRIVLTVRAKAAGKTNVEIAEEILKKTKKPNLRGKFKVCAES